MRVAVIKIAGKCSEIAGKCYRGEAKNLVFIRLFDHNFFPNT
nr:MAG TPA: hypothetical protein [Caudoviricetes sp.]